MASEQVSTTWNTNKPHIHTKHAHLYNFSTCPTSGWPLSKNRVGKKNCPSSRDRERKKNKLTHGVYSPKESAKKLEERQAKLTAAAAFQQLLQQLMREAARRRAEASPRMSRPRSSSLHLRTQPPLKFTAQSMLLILFSANILYRDGFGNPRGAGVVFAGRFGVAHFW